MGVDSSSICLLPFVKLPQSSRVPVSTFFLPLYMHVYSITIPLHSSHLPSFIYIYIRPSPRLHTTSPSPITQPRPSLRPHPAPTPLLEREQHPLHRPPHVLHPLSVPPQNSPHGRNRGACAAARGPPSERRAIRDTSVVLWRRVRDRTQRTASQR